jgi:hypothetical protein
MGQLRAIDGERQEAGERRFAEAGQMKKEKRFRLDNKQWLTLCGEFHLETNWHEEHNAKIFNLTVDRKQTARWHRHELENACSAYYSSSASPASQRKALVSFISAVDVLLESYKAIPSDHELARTLIRDIKIALPSSMFAKEYSWGSLPGNEERDICADLLKHVEVMRNSAKDVLALDADSRSLRQPGQKFLLSALCNFWKNVLLLSVSRASVHDDDGSSGKNSTSQGSHPFSKNFTIERFLIRVPEVIFELNISPTQADRSIRDFLKDSKKEFDRYVIHEDYMTPEEESALFMKHGLKPPKRKSKGSKGS